MKRGRTLIKDTAADRIRAIAVDPERCCPVCHGLLEHKGSHSRHVIESRPNCPRCRTASHAPLPGVLPRSLYGNALMTTAATCTICTECRWDECATRSASGRAAELKCSLGSRVCLHTCQQEGSNTTAPRRSSTPMRPAGARRARTAPRGCSPRRRGAVFSVARRGRPRRPEQSLATGPCLEREWLLVTPATTKVPCAIQSCSAHLLREVDRVAQACPDAADVTACAITLAPLLALAMGLRNQHISDKQFSATSAEVKAQIIAVVESPAAHLGIRRIQNIFRDNASRLYHWAANRAIPAENNLAERDLRPTVIARKVSFGSQSDAGAKTRGLLMSVLVPLKTRGFNVTTHLTEVLDEIARNPTHTPFPLLFPRAGP